MRAQQRVRRDAFLASIGTRPIVIGILNLTPDSFSDGGLYVTAFDRHLQIEDCRARRRTRVHFN